MEVEVISRETVKPSSPTPLHLRTFKLSIFDQILPTIYVPFLIHYPSSAATNNRSDDKVMSRLRASLAETLTRFYPLAGRVKDHHSIDCNDEGALFCTARVKCAMSHLLSPQPKIYQQFSLLPRVAAMFNGRSDDVQVAIQVNMFECGGVSIGFLFLHRIIDAVTIASFLKCWAKASNDSNFTWSVDYSAPLLFPSSTEAMLPDDLRSAMLKDRSIVMKRPGKGVTKRFVFDAASISSLRARATSKLVPDPTRFEALSCFIWKHAMATTRTISSSSSPPPSSLNCTVDLRRRMVPPLTENSVGNLVWKAIALCCDNSNDNGVNGSDHKLQGLVAQLRGALNKVKDEFLAKAQGGNGGLYGTICSALAELGEANSCMENLNPYSIVSWCGLGVGEVDLGWGKPAWVSYLGVSNHEGAHSNVVQFIESGCHRDKIEAWITLDDREMDQLEKDGDFLAFASPNPSLS